MTQPPASPPPPPPAAPPPGHGYGQAPPPPLRPDEERTWAIVGHLTPLVGLSFIAPLVIWLVFRGRGPYLENQAKESLNFQLTLLIAYVVGGVLTVIGIGLLILLAAWVVSVIFGIMAAIAVSKYEWYRYPISIRMVS